MDNVERKLVKNVHWLALTYGICKFDDCNSVCSCRCCCRSCTLQQKNTNISVVFLDEFLLMYLQFKIIIMSKIYLISGKVENVLVLFLGGYAEGMLYFHFNFGILTSERAYRLRF